jgi:predicted kinase
MKLVIVSGAEATGKTYFGKFIADKLGFVYLAKDVIKERLFNTESVSTWNYGWYEQKAKDTFFAEIKKQVEAGNSIVVESNFIGNDKGRLLEILSGKSIDISEVHCFTRGFVSFKRFVYRNETKSRHPGHHDRRWYIPVFTDIILSNLKIHDAHAAVKISDKVMFLDTTDFQDIDPNNVLSFFA